MNFNSKNGKRRCFSYETKASISSIPMRKMRLWCLITKRKEIILWIRVGRNRPMNINSKNGAKRCFSYEIKASIPFIPMRRMCLRCPIMKWKEIMMWIRVYANLKTNFNSINGRKRSISYQTKASIHLSQCGEWIYGAQSLKGKRLLCKSELIQLKNQL